MSDTTWAASHANTPGKVFKGCKQTLQQMGRAHAHHPVPNTAQNVSSVGHILQSHEDQFIPPVMGQAWHMNYKVTRRP